jgi:hypothetical protein
MKEDNHLISIQTICRSYNISNNFVRKMEDFELIKVEYNRNPQGEILDDHIKDFERMIRLHQDLKINLEGLHAIRVLQSKIDKLEKELCELKNKYGPLY